MKQSENQFAQETLEMLKASIEYPENSVLRTLALSFAETDNLDEALEKVTVEYVEYIENGGTEEAVEIFLYETMHDTEKMLVEGAFASVDDAGKQGYYRNDEMTRWIKLEFDK